MRGPVITSLREITLLHNIQQDNSYFLTFTLPWPASQPFGSGRLLTIYLSHLCQAVFQLKNHFLGTTGKSQRQGDSPFIVAELSLDIGEAAFGQLL